jgi:hypothetical protein
MKGELSATCVIDCPLLEVFDYVSDPINLPEWGLLYSSVKLVKSKQPKILSSGDTFIARLSLLPGWFEQILTTAWLPGYPLVPEIEIRIDDVVYGRRVAYRANTGWTIICDFEPAAGRTIFTVSHSLWSLQGIMFGYWMSPAQAFLRDLIHRSHQALKQRLEGRETEAMPKIFLSYRRSDAHFVGGRIFDSLVGEFGAGTVFRDTDSLLAGRSWKDDILKTVRDCQVVVVHIGENWENLLIDRANSDDFFREEIESALAGKARIIPVITTSTKDSDVHGRMLNIEKKLGNEDLRAKVPRMIEKFT